MAKGSENNSFSLGISPCCPKRTQLDDYQQVFINYSNRKEAEMDQETANIFLFNKKDNTFLWGDPNFISPLLIGFKEL